jgi:L-glutamine-phosphate cytidylyltransferase
VSAAGHCRAVILAAGRGTRLGDLAVDRPKVMVELAGRTLLAHQRTALAAAGITDVHGVLGHGADLVVEHPDAAGLTFWINPDYATTNMVATLVHAHGALDGTTDVIIAYGDIVYEPRLVRALDAVDADVSVAVDTAWRAYWEARMEDPLEDAETLRMDGDGRLLEVGRRPDGYADIEAQYLGLIRVRADAVQRFRDAAVQLVTDDPRAFMTTLLQGLVDGGWDVKVAPVSNGWLEIDRPEDLQPELLRFWDPGSEALTPADGARSGDR